jgi:hypothetical protein
MEKLHALDEQPLSRFTMGDRYAMLTRDDRFARTHFSSLFLSSIVLTHPHINHAPARLPLAASGRDRLKTLHQIAFLCPFEFVDPEPCFLTG